MNASTTTTKPTTSEIPMKQFDTVFHTQHGKGHIMAVIYKPRNNVYMCYFPNGKVTEFVTHENLVTDTDRYVSLHEREEEEPQVSDSIQQALENLFGGGQSPMR